MQLTKKAVHELEDNGYKYKHKADLIVFKRASDYVSVIVIFAILLFVSIPIFAFNTFLGILTVLLAIGGVFVKIKYYSKKMNFTINLQTQKFSFYDNAVDLDNQSLSFASKISLRSRFKDEYASAFKNTSEEHEITMNLELMSGTVLTLFKFHSDYAKPSEEIEQVHNLIKNIIITAKKMQAKASSQTSVAG